MDALFTKVVKCKDRTYFIDVREAKNKSRYLSITESKRSASEEGKFDKHTINVFKEQLDPFQEALAEAVEAAR